MDIPFLKNNIERTRDATAKLKYLNEVNFLYSLKNESHFFTITCSHTKLSSSH